MPTCPTADPNVQILLDGVLQPDAGLGPSSLTAESGETETHRIEWANHFGLLEYLYEPGQDTTHTFAVWVNDVCAPKNGHITINSVSIDVTGIR